MNIQLKAVDCQQSDSVCNITTNSCIILNMTIADRIKLAMEARGIKQQELAEAGGIKQQTLSKLLKSGDFTTKALPEFAKKLEVDIVWLQFGKGNIPDFCRSIPPDHLPIILWTDAVNFPSVKITDKTPSILKTQNATDSCYALEIQNDMMCRRLMSFQPGTKIIVNPDLKPNNFDYVVAYESGADVAFMRRYVKDGLQIQLNALNSQYRNIMLTDTVKILGVVIARVDLFI